MLLSKLKQHPQLMDLYDAISDNLPRDEAERWQKRFLAIRVEADLSTIHHKFFVWLLSVSVSDMPSVKEVVRLHQAVIDGEEVTKEQWRKASDACRKDTTREDAYSSYAAAYSTDYLTDAIAIRCANRSYRSIADKLIELLKAA